MKQLNTLIAATVLLIAALQSNAQTTSEKPWQVRRAYLSANAGTDGGFGVALHFNNGWAAMASSISGSNTAKNLPHDYQAGSGTVLWIPINGSDPRDEFKSYTLGMGKVLTTASDKGWIMATAGINVCQYSKQVFVRNNNPTNTYTPTYDWFTALFGISQTSYENYDHHLEKETGFGASLGLQANVNLFRFMGLGGGANLQVNTAAIIPSAWVGINVGIMRPAKQKLVRQ